MNDSKWKQDFEGRVIEILRSAQFDLKQSHPFGIPFVSVYQIAVAFEQNYPDVCRQYSKGIGGEYSGMAHLVTYIAWQLKKSIEDNPAYYPVEGVWLSARGLDNLHFKHNNSIKTGHPNENFGGFSMYRIRE